MADLRYVRAIDATYVAKTKQVRSRIEEYVKARFLAGEYRDIDLVRFLNEVVPAVRAARLEMSALTDAYLSQLLTAKLDVLIPPMGPIDTDALRGVPIAEVYTRPFTTVRTALANGADYPAAVQQGLYRSVDLVVTDMQLAKTHTSQAVFSARSQVHGYRRVLHGSKSCALCYIASTQRYHKADLLPIHPGCDCGVDPILEDGGQVIDRSRLEATHEAVAARLGQQDRGGRKPDYRKQIIVHEHGEIGPLLAVRDQHFTGPSAI